MSKIKGKIHLNGFKSLSLNTPCEDFLHPEVVYFPVNTDSVQYERLVNDGDHVLKGQPILKRIGRFDHLVCSSVSGTVLGIKKAWHSSGKLSEMLEIKNDMQDETCYQKPKDNISREEFVELVKNAGIVGMGGAAFPTYVKYMPTDDAEIVIINAAECEPYITCDYTAILNNASKLVRGLKYIMKYNGARLGVIAIKKNKLEAIEALKIAMEQESGDDLNVSLFPLKDVYPAGWEKYIVSHVTNRSYKSLPREVGCIVNNVQTAIAICELMETGAPLMERIVTISGDGIEKTHNFKTLIGTNIKDLLPLCGAYTNPDADSFLICGGPMTGRTMIFDDLVITPGVGSIIVKTKHQGVSLECIGCGKCQENCPTNLTPTAIRQAYLQKDIRLLNELSTTKCVQCGLCSFVCPSRVEVTDYVGKAKQLLLNNRK